MKKSDTLIVVYVSDDGDISMKSVNRKVLKSQLKEGDYGDDILVHTKCAEGDLNESPPGLYIIEGRFVSRGDI